MRFIVYILLTVLLFTCAAEAKIGDYRGVSNELYVSLLYVIHTTEFFFVILRTDYFHSKERLIYLN